MPRGGANRSNEAELRAELEAIRGRYISLTHGDGEAAVPAAERALDIATTLGDEREIAFARYLIGAAHMIVGNYEVALEALDSSMRDYERIGQEYGWNRSYYCAASVWVMMGEYRKAIAMLEEVLAYYRRIDNRERSIAVLWSLANAWSVTGDLHAALERYLEGMELIDGPDKELLAGYMHSGIGSILLELEDYEAAEEHIERAREIFARLDEPPPYGSTLIQLGWLHMNRGDLDRAFACASQGAVIVEKQGTRRDRCSANLVLGGICRRQGRYDEALGYLEYALATGSSTIRMMAMGEIGAVHAFSGRASEALGMLGEALGMAEHEGNLHAIAKCHNYLHEAYRALGDAERALHHYRIFRETQGALTGNEQQRRIRRMQPRLDAALHKDVAPSADASRSGGGAAEQIIASVDPEFLRNLSRRFPQLTPSELRVCALARLGLAAKEMTGILHIEARSVEVYRTRIRKKMGLARTTSLTTFLASL